MRSQRQRGIPRTANWPLNEISTKQTKMSNRKKFETTPNITNSVLMWTKEKLWVKTSSVHPCFSRELRSSGVKKIELHANLEK
jgi:hypothetical protein